MVIWKMTRLECDKFPSFLRQSTTAPTAQSPCDLAPSTQQCCKASVGSCTLGPAHRRLVRQDHQWAGTKHSMCALKISRKSKSRINNQQIVNKKGHDAGHKWILPEVVKLQQMRCLGIMQWYRMTWLSNVNPLRLQGLAGLMLSEYLFQPTLISRSRRWTHQVISILRKCWGYGMVGLAVIDDGNAGL